MKYSLCVTIVATFWSLECFAFTLRETQKRGSVKMFGANNNIVIRPSEDAAAFDSLKVGGCRVHRYQRDEFDSETEYVMW